MHGIKNIKEKIGKTNIRLGAGALFGAETILQDSTLAARTVRLTACRTAYLLAALAICALYLAFIAHGTAFAQQGGGDVVQSALQKAIDWLSGLMIALGTLGFLISVCVKAIAGTNEGRHHMAHMGMAGAAVAVVAGLLAPGIMEIFAGFAGGGQ